MAAVLDTEHYRGLVAANPALHADFLARVRGFRWQTA